MSARILVVEDNKENLELMEFLLEAFGYSPVLAASAADGVAAAADEAFDLVLMDLQMPAMDGYEAMAAIRAGRETAYPPIVAVTAMAMVGDRERILGAGFDGYIAKPIDPMGFARQVEQYLATGREV